MLYLSRHGNTFNSSAEAVWVGGGDDLPLVPSGVKQAKIAGEAFKNAGIEIDAIYAAPLKRTYGYGEIICDILDNKPVLISDERLREVNYGKWAGLNNDEIIRLYGKEDMDNWQNHGIWPPSGGFHPPHETIIEGVIELAAEIAALMEAEPEKNIMVISSNGVLRYFLKTIPNAYENAIKEGDFKVLTGRLCGFDGVKGNSETSYKCQFWNKKPEVSLLQNNIKISS